MAIGPPSTPNLQQKRLAPAAPKRNARLNDNTQQNPDFFLTSPPKETTQPVIISPFRASTRVPLLQLSTNNIGTDSPTGMMNLRFSRFTSDISNTIKGNRGNWNLIPPKRELSLQQYPNTTTPLTEFTKTSDTITVYYDSEPMDMEMALMESENKTHMNDQMEVDIDDDSMEIDTIADTESLMDYIPMH
uniref:DP domain-containing protein n=1 Tax=Caenorhabditis tropicalis TaxID=1561998 RepID=A0A1I7UG24_9PELO